MSIDDAVQNKVEDILHCGGYCNAESARAIAEEVSKDLQEKISVEMLSLGSEIDKLREMNDRLWDVIHKISEPKFPKMHQFFRFRWLKFWRGWNIRFWQK